MLNFGMQIIELHPITKRCIKIQFLRLVLKCSDQYTEQEAFSGTISE